MWWVGELQHHSGSVLFHTHSLFVCLELYSAVKQDETLHEELVIGSEAPWVETILLMRKQRCN